MKNRKVTFLLAFGMACALALSAAQSFAEHGKASGNGAHADHSTHDQAQHALEGQAPLPGRSVYQLPGTWTKAEGGTMTLAELRGQPVVAVLFYGTCAHACPVLLHDLQRLEKKLTDDELHHVKFLLVTFDPENDTPESLATLAEDKGYDLERWKFLHGDAHQVRELAVLLGVQYRPTGEGNFSHTSRLSLLDRDGLIVTEADGLDNPHKELLEPLRVLLGTADAKRGFFQKLFGWLND